MPELLESPFITEPEEIDLLLNGPDEPDDDDDFEDDDDDDDDDDDEDDDDDDDDDDLSDDDDVEGEVEGDAAIDNEE